MTNDLFLRACRRQPVDRTRGEVNELRPSHVAGYAILVRPFRAHPRFDFRFDLPHGLVDRLLERFQNPRILGELIDH